MILQEIHARGGRKFGFINLPEVGCLPGLRIIKPDNNGSCLEEASSLTKLHNKALSKLLIKLENQLEGFKYSLYDLNSNLRKRMKHPRRYGTYTMQRNIINHLCESRIIHGLQLRDSKKGLYIGCSGPL